MYPQARRVTRYATEKTGMLFDRTRLARLAARLCPVGPALSREYNPLSTVFGQSLEPGSGGPVSHPCGLCPPRSGDGGPPPGRLVAGAASYSRYRGGIEVEVDTHPACRGQGLATAASAALLLACLDRGLYPSWDAHTRQSLALAEKLGYRYSHAYPAYEVAWTP